MTLANYLKNNKINILTYILIFTLFFGRKFNLSYFWHQVRLNNYLDIIIDAKYIFVVICIFICFGIRFGFKTKTSYFLGLMAIITASLSFVSGTAFHRVERFAFVSGLILAYFIWQKYILIDQAKSTRYLTGLMVFLPLMFDHFLVSESSGVFILLYLGLSFYIFEKSHKNFNILLKFLLVFLGINAVVAFLQILLGRSLNLNILGESVFDLQNQSGLASDIIGQVKIVRGYGLFSHPNILGFLGSASLIYFTVTKKITQKYVKIGLLLSLVCILLSTSRIAIIFGLAVIGVRIFESKVKKPKLHFFVWISVAALLYIFINRFNLSDLYRIGDIQKFFSAYAQTNNVQKIFGIGLGTYPYFLKSINPGLEVWQYEPVHNSFLLILMEFGIGSLTIIALVLNLSKKNPESKTLWCRSKSLSFQKTLSAVLSYIHSRILKIARWRFLVLLF
jgi:hypothetical protein